MRKFSKVVILTFIFLSFYFATSYAARKGEEIKQYPSPADNQMSRQDMQAPKPILPPAVPSGSVGTSPTHVEIPQPPLIANTIGEVSNVGSERDGTVWIEVKDQLFGGLLKIKLKDLKNTPIVKQGAIMHFEDIKAGDVVDVMFKTEGEENIASFIRIPTEEELERIKAAEPGQLATEGTDNQPDK